MYSYFLSHPKSTERKRESFDEKSGLHEKRTQRKERKYHRVNERQSVRAHVDAVRGEPDGPPAPGDGCGRRGGLGRLARRGRRRAHQRMPLQPQPIPTHPSVLPFRLARATLNIRMMYSCVRTDVACVLACRRRRTRTRRCATSRSRTASPRPSC